MSGDHEKFMAMAIEEARIGMKAGERPFGSVVVRDGELIVRAHNVVNSAKDPTAHAEVTTIRKAAAKLGTLMLPGCTLYTSCHPCPMCAGATLYSGIKTIVIGASHAALRRYAGDRYSVNDYTIGRLVELTGHKLEIITGVLEKEAEEVFREYKGWDTEPPGPTQAR